MEEPTKDKEYIKIKDLLVAKLLMHATFQQLAACINSFASLLFTSKLLLLLPCHLPTQPC
jgi:hypothetical protein